MDKCLKCENNFIVINRESCEPYFTLSVGALNDATDFAVSYREQMYFLCAKNTRQVKDIPKETQFLLTRNDDNTYSLLIPLVLDGYHASVFGGSDNKLYITIENGDCKGSSLNGPICYISRGENLYTLIENAANDITALLPNCTKRQDKPVPEIADYFGLCTWESCRFDVGPEIITKELEYFKENGFVPKFLLLDDGWLSIENKGDRGKSGLTDFAPNENFKDGFAPFVSKIKKDYGIKLFYVWHAIMGYWGGTSASSDKMKKYNIEEKNTYISRTYYETQNALATYLEFPFGCLPPEKSFDFYNDFHKYLKSEGVDGVKVDSQAVLEAHGMGNGGRVVVAEKIHQALEASTHLNFGGELINCMSCSNDIIFNTKASNMMRSSGDFTSEDTSHGRHIYTNAQNTLYMGLFTHCDWDMFDTLHKYGELHAASRAISGSPVYISDKIGKSDFSIISALTLENGKIPRPLDMAKPTIDSVFCDPFNNEVFYKMFNFNVNGGVLGAFYMSDKGAETLKGEVSPLEIEGLGGEKFAVYCYKSRQKALCRKNESIGISCKLMGYEIITFAEVKNGFAPIGLTGKMNSGGTIKEYKILNEYLYIVSKGGGEFLIYCENKPSEIKVNGSPVRFSWEDGFAALIIEENGESEILVK